MREQRPYSGGTCGPFDWFVPVGARTFKSAAAYKCAELQLVPKGVAP
jgi:hypothetical protein